MIFLDSRRYNPVDCIINVGFESEKQYLLIFILNRKVSLPTQFRAAGKSLASNHPVRYFL